MSVARSSAPVVEALTWTPESACTALRVEATRDTIASCPRRSAHVVENFTKTTSKRR